MLFFEETDNKIHRAIVGGCIIALCIFGIIYVHVVL